MSTHCIIHKETDPYFNLAMEEYLFSRSAETGDGYVVLWRNRPTVVVGRFQNAAGEVNSSFIKNRSVEVVRRMTGGGAVYHDLGNLNYTFILSIGDRDSKGLDFALYTKPLLDYLGEIGVSASLSGRNDLSIAGKKFSGNAQHISRDMLLHHGTILFDSCLEDVAEALSVDPEKFRSKGVASVRSRVTNVVPHILEPMDIEDFTEGLMSFFAAPYGVEPRELSDQEVDDINLLRDSKYTTWDWVWGASPPFSMTAEKRFEKGKVQVYLDIRTGVIEQAAIRGDFFSAGDPAELERALSGVKYDVDSVSKALARFNMSDYMMGISSENLISLIVE